MFPSGNIVRQTSKFDENVPVWEPLAARMVLTREGSPTGTSMPTARPAAAMAAPVVDRMVFLPGRKRKELFFSDSVFAR